MSKEEKKQAARAPGPTKTEQALLWMMGQLEKRGDVLDDLLHPDMPKERFMASCRLAFAKNPDLTDLALTDGESLMQALMLGARSGLDVHGHYGHLVSFQKRKFQDGGRDVWKAVIVYMSDWKGLLATAKAAGVLLDAEPALVYAKDLFKITGGDERHIIHEPYISKDPKDDKGIIIAAFVRIMLPSGRWVAKGLLLLEDIIRIEAGIKAQNGPWGGPHRGEMVKKSSFRQGWKWIGATTSDRATALRLAALEEAEAIEGEYSVVTEAAPPPLRGVEGAKAAVRARLTTGATREELEVSTTEKVPVSSEPDDAEKAAILAQERALAEPGANG